VVAETIHFAYVLPVLALLLMCLAGCVAGCVRTWRPSMGCVRTAAATVLCGLAAPFIIVGVILRLVVQYPSRVVHPLDAGLHFVVGVSVAVLSWTCESNVPVVGVLWLHCAFLLYALVDLLAFKRLEWRRGILWWCFALHCSFMATLIAGRNCVFFEGVGTPDHYNEAVHYTCFFWTLLIAVVVVVMHREDLRNYFRLWQNQHGTFILQRGSGPSAAAQQELTPPLAPRAHDSPQERRQHAPADDADRVPV